MTLLRFGFPYLILGKGTVVYTSKIYKVFIFLSLFCMVFITLELGWNKASLSDDAEEVAAEVERLAEELDYFVATGRCVRCNLSNADMSDQNFSGARLTNAVLEQSNLSGSNLSRAELMGAKMHGAKLM